MIKLLIVIPTLDQSGAEKQFGLLACGLPQDEFDVRVVALTRGGPYEELLRSHGISYQILHKRWRLDPQTILKLRREIQSFQPDVLLSCLFSGNATARLATTGLRSRPLTMISERCVDSWKSRWQFWVDRHLQRRTDLLIANSSSVADFYGKQGFPRERMTVIANGVEPPPAPTVTREELCRELRIPENSKLVSFVGRLAPQKQLRCLIWATQLLRQTDERTRFLIIGDGPERGALELYARDVEASGFVRFLGHRKDASSLLHLTDVFWLASEFEGMSNSLMEAMICGKPVVVSDIPPNRELVQHGQHGYLINPGDSVGFSQYTHKLFQDENLAKQLGQAGQQRMTTEFSVSQMVDRYATLLKEAVKNDRSVRGK